MALGRWELDHARYCDKPILIQYEGRTTTAGRTRSMFIDQNVPCRKCDGCLRAKQREWTARAIAEVRVAPRTWFITFTFAAHNQAVMGYRARVRNAKFASMTEAERFHRLHLEAGREITLFMKRLRKKAKSPVRYLYVVEPHKSGLPHYHMLLHESYREISKRTIESCWHLGFMKAKLATKSRAYYVCKYISKSAQCRVRASLHYGAGQWGGTETVRPSA